MIPRSVRFASPLVAWLALVPLAAADNHKWEIKEIFSSADEQVQFIELFNADKDEENLSQTSISSASGGFFIFPNNLPNSATQNRHVLLATAAFAAIPGAPTPDYVIPAGFFDRAGDTVTYAAGPHVVSFGALPNDGQKSINASGVQALNSPTNFAGLSASLTLATATVRNGTGVNDLCYSASAPAMGKPWSGSVNVAGHPGATAAFVFGHTLPGSGPVFPFGEMLVNAASPQVFARSKAANGGLTTFTAQMPVNLALLGRTIATQGGMLGGGLELCNAVDMKIGW